MALSLLGKAVSQFEFLPMTPKRTMSLGRWDIEYVLSSQLSAI